MPRAQKPPRLWLEPERLGKAGQVTHVAIWIILDAGKKSSTGCLAADHAGAAEALQAYLIAKHAGVHLQKNKAATDIMIADVLRHYVEVTTVADVKELTRRVEQLLGYWGDMTLDAIDSGTCKKYVTYRAPSEGSARRELEDLRSAVNLAIADKLCREAVTVTLPKKPKGRKDFLERNTAAKLIWHAYRKKGTQTLYKGDRKGEVITTTRRPTLHIARFILFGLYTGTRSRRVWMASFYREEGRPWIDVDNGIYYREAPGESASDNKRAPSIRLPKRLVAHLRRWRDGGCNPTMATRYLCEYAKGKPCDPKKGFAKLIDDVLGPEGKEIVRHSLRHTAATWLLQSAQDPHAVAGYLGMRTDTLISVYGHHHPDYQDAIGDAFSSGRAGRTAKKPAAEKPKSHERLRTIGGEQSGI